MRLPFTLSELSVIQSGGRLFVQLFGFAAVLLGLWGATVILDRAIEAPDEIADSIELPDSDAPYLTFPYDADLVHRDRRVISAILVSRPTPDKLTIQRKSDGRTFLIGLDTLAPTSIALVKQFPIQSSKNPVTAIVTQFQSHLVLPENIFALPHYCTLVSKEGITLPVALLSRETVETVKVRRRKDGKLFTIPLSRLIESDQELISQFPLASDEKNGPELSEGLSLP